MSRSDMTCSSVIQSASNGPQALCSALGAGGEDTRVHKPSGISDIRQVGPGHALHIPPGGGEAGKRSGH